MTTQRLLFALTLANAAILVFSVVHPRSTAAQDPAPVLRGRALELVDDHGRVRASIHLYPADPNVKMPDGTRGYPETVLLRLITSQGRPTVKIAATEDGSSIVLGGDADPTYIQFLARGGTPRLKFVDKNSKELIVKP